jgi:predicted metal-dependent phosphoesterase TrpH
MLYTLMRDGKFFKGNLHTHTTVSDGELTPGETARLYRDAGYSFIAITDHNRWGSYPELSDDKLLVLPGSEIDTVYEGGIHHIVAVAKPGCKLENGYIIPPEKRRGQHPQAIIDYILENGCIAVYAHPFWSYADHNLLASLKGLTGMEIVNYSCEQEWKSGIAEIYFEYLWRDGSKIWCFGSDDAHGHVPDYCGGYITVKAESLTHEAIIEAISRGSFYASYSPSGSAAPELYDFYVKDNVAYVECSPCRNIYLNVSRKHPEYKASHGRPDRPITRHSWELPPSAGQVKCILTGFNGSITWSQPIILK